MTPLQAFILGIIEGITEFLPISSTGHMVLASSLMGLAEDAFVKAFEVIIQFGAILTVLCLYWRRFLPQWGFYRKILVAFFPTAILGFLLKKQVDLWLESPALVAVALFVGGVILIAVDRKWADRSANGKTTAQLTDPDCVKLGLFQSLAMVPGVSRSGATIVGGLFLGMSRREAAEFSFFLAVPTMAAATLYKAYKLFAGGIQLGPDQWACLAIGFVTSFVVAALAIKFFISYLQRKGFAIFGWYRIVLGALILILLASGHELHV